MSSPTSNENFEQMYEYPSPEELYNIRYHFCTEAFSDPPCKLKPKFIQLNRLCLQGLQCLYGRKSRTRRTRSSGRFAHRR